METTTRDNAERVEITSTDREELVDKIDLALSAERLEAATMLLYDMQDDFFRSYEPTADLSSAENAAILYLFRRYRAQTAAIADLLHLIGEDFKRLDITA